MPLTDVEIRKNAPREKKYRLADGGGMYLEVHPNGSRYWHLKYRLAAKEKLLALGVYPTVTLKEAREKRENAKKKLSNGIDPGEARQAEKRTLIATMPKTPSRQSRGNGMQNFQRICPSRTPSKTCAGWRCTSSRTSALEQ
ncbi:MAG: Arm DNA-binding domain-containing protein [Burkholderia sp.]